MVKVLVYKIPAGNPVDMPKRPAAFKKMEEDLSQWSQLGWRIVGTSIDDLFDGEDYVVFLQK